MSLLVQISILLGLLFILFTFFWLWQEKTKEADIVDVGWASTLGLSALYYALTSEGLLVRKIFLALIAGFWAIRLASHLYRDRVRKPGEDARYHKLREMWPKNASRNFFFVFQGQALLVLLLSVPMLIASQSSAPLTYFDFAAFAIAFFAIVGENISDAQLKAFKAKPESKGKTCRQGLWRYSRHPNYFFEWVYWWAYVLLAVGHSYFWLTFMGPVVMYIFLTQITGIPPTERHAVSSRGDDYRNYQKTTSPFFPWFPKEALNRADIN